MAKPISIEVWNPSGKYRVISTKPMPGTRWIRLLTDQDCRVEICTEKKTVLSVEDILALIGHKCDGVIGQVMPEKCFFGRRPPVPLWNKDIKIIIGEPIEFDLQSLKQTAKTASRDSCIHCLGWPNATDGLDEAAQKWLYIYISDQIRIILERLRIFGATFKRFNV